MKLDWDVIDDELYHIPAAYKEPKFESLKHVLTVLGGTDSEAALQEVGFLTPPLLKHQAPNSESQSTDAAGADVSLRHVDSDCRHRLGTEMRCQTRLKSSRSFHIAVLMKDVILHAVSFDPV